MRSMYIPQRLSTSQFVDVRHMRYHLRTWGQPSSTQPPLVLMHGWMDVSASFQFVVDDFSADFVQDRYIVAADWRGFGHSRSAHPVDHYHFSDYLADLDALLQHIAPNGQAVDLVGHSMGGHVCSMYAGARPARVRRLVNLEGFGLESMPAAQAPQRMRRWLDELQQLHVGDIRLPRYPDAQAVAQRLRKTNPRLPQDRALWLAQQWAQPDADGQWHILGDAAHKVVNPQLFRLEEALAFYSAITAPTLAVHGSDDSLHQWFQGRYTLEQFHARLQFVPQCRTAQVDGAGHMLHHDQPAQVAHLIEDFVQSKADTAC